MRKRICVLHANVPFQQGGAELHVCALVTQLKLRGYDAELIQLPYKWYPEEELYNNLLMWRLLDLSEVNEQKIDMVIGTKFPSYGAIHPNKIAWVIHQYRQAYELFDTDYGLSNTPNGKIIQNKIKKFDNISLGECKKVYANSKNVANRLKKYNGIESTPLYHPPKLFGKYICKEEEGYILSVGRLDPLKRVDLLIKALSYCDKNITVKIAGKGPELEDLKKLAFDLKVDERIDFLGFVTDEELIELYAGCNAVYYAPIDEDYGYVTLEAFLSKKPIITCKDSGGVLEFVKNEISGYITDPLAEDLGSKIQELIMNKKRGKEFGANGYEKVKGITWDHVIEELTENIRS